MSAAAFAKYPMGAVITAWLAKIDLGLAFKRRRFDKDAEAEMTAALTSFKKSFA